MVCVIELEIEQCGDHRATAHECVQHRIQATYRAYGEMMEACRVFNTLLNVYSILDRFGYIVADVPVHQWSFLNGLSCVKAVRESKLHQHTRKCDNQ